MMDTPLPVFWGAGAVVGAPPLPPRARPGPPPRVTGVGRFGSLLCTVVCWGLLATGVAADRGLGSERVSEVFVVGAGPLCGSLGQSRLLPEWERERWLRGPKSHRGTRTLQLHYFGLQFLDFCLCPQELSVLQSPLVCCSTLPLLDGLLDLLFVRFFPFGFCGGNDGLDVCSRALFRGSPRDGFRCSSLKFFLVLSTKTFLPRP